MTSPPTTAAAPSRTGSRPARGSTSGRRTRRRSSPTPSTQTWRHVATALADGRLHLDQARVIVKALDALPDDVSVEVKQLAERRLVEDAEQFGPTDLARLGRRVLDVVAPEVGDEQERRALERAERKAEAVTRLDFKRRGDGSTDIAATVPDADRGPVEDLPRVLHLTAAARTRNGVDPATGVRLPADRQRGHAFCALLERLDPSQAARPRRSGHHRGRHDAAGDAADRSRHRTARHRRTRHRRRRPPPGLPAGLVPAVLGTRSEVLDLGRTARLFSPGPTQGPRPQHPSAGPRTARSPHPGARPTTPPPWSHGGQDRPRRRRPALPLAPQTRPRHPLRPTARPGRRPQVPPAHVTRVRSQPVTYDTAPRRRGRLPGTRRSGRPPSSTGRTARRCPHRPRPRYRDGSGSQRRGARGEHPEVCDRRLRERQTPVPGAVRRRRTPSSPQPGRAPGCRPARRRQSRRRRRGRGRRRRRTRRARRASTDRRSPSGCRAAAAVEERGGDEVAGAPRARGVPGHVSRMPQRTPSRTRAGEQNGRGAPHDTKAPRSRLRAKGQVWQVQDSNLRRNTPTDLQSAPIGRSGNLPGVLRAPTCVVWTGDNEAQG